MRNGMMFIGIIHLKPITYYLAIIYYDPSLRNYIYFIEIGPLLF